MLKQVVKHIGHYVNRPAVNVGLVAEQTKEEYIVPEKKEDDEEPKVWVVEEAQAPSVKNKKSKKSEEND